MSVDSPKYEVLRREDSIEVRRYAPYLTASVRVPATGHQEAAYAGFGVLADYIFGNNVEHGSIPMAAPVTSSRSAGVRIPMAAPVTSERVRSEQLEGAVPLCTQHCAGEYVVRFTMPSRYTSVADLPEPNDARVELAEVPGRLAVAVRFGGRLSEKSVAEVTARIEQWISREGLVAVGEPEVAQYDAPWIPGFIRHNEVLVPIQAD